MESENLLIKADLHIHTCYSDDAVNSLDELIERCQSLDLDCIAVCDHGTIEGAVLLQKTAPFKVIVAEEILTPHGEIMGMFLKETIPSGFSVKETIDRVREQNGKVCIPHPFDPYRSSALQLDILENITDEIDLLEVFNARTIPLQNMSKPRKFALKHTLRMGAGSDAHTLGEVGRAYVTMPDFNDQDDFLKAIEKAEIHGRSANLLLFAWGMAGRLKRKVFGKH
jgi:predicted metal-dependent phosphoesterase TrpH